MTLETELNKLKDLYGTEKGVEHIRFVVEKFTSKEEKKTIADFVKKIANEDIISTKERIDKLIADANRLLGKS